MTIVPSTFSTAATATMPGILNQAVFASVVKGEKQYCKIRKYFHNLTFFSREWSKKKMFFFFKEKKATARLRLTSLLQVKKRPLSPSSKTPSLGISVVLSVVLPFTLAAWSASIVILDLLCL